MQLKRLWDITNKKMVFVKGPTGHDCQVWTNNDGSKMFIYDMAQWLEYTQSAGNDGKVYGPTWTKVDGDDDMGVYDTNNPTELFTWESGDKVSYVFKNYDGTVLKEGKVKEGTAPTPPADPTKPSTAAETFTFTGWNPTVAPITKKTTYTAQYEASPRNYTVTIGVSPEGAGTVDTQQVTVAYGTEITYSSNVLMIGSNEITATAGSGYAFSSWGTLPETVTETLTITATFQAEGYTLTFTPRDENNNQEGGGTLSEQSYVVTQDGCAIWSNTSYDFDLHISTNPSEYQSSIIKTIIITPDSGKSVSSLKYYDEGTSTWEDIDEYGGTIINGDMQIRVYFI